MQFLLSDRGIPWTLQPGAAELSLSAQLRTQTALLHKQAELLLDLPGAIRTRGDYLAWLDRFLGFYQPLECCLAAFSEWDELGLALPSRRQTFCLTADLAALGANPEQVLQISPGLLPDLPTFAHALGALYVLEGATLGGAMIMRDLEGRIGASISGATRFFGGRGKALGPMWHSFRVVLDEFGREQPQLCSEVVSGAERTFGALLLWFGAVAAARS